MMLLVENKWTHKVVDDKNKVFRECENNTNPPDTNKLVETIAEAGLTRQELEEAGVIRGMVLHICGRLDQSFS